MSRQGKNWSKLFYMWRSQSYTQQWNNRYRVKIARLCRDFTSFLQTIMSKMSNLQVPKCKKKGFPNVIGCHCMLKVHVHQWEHRKNNQRKFSTMYYMLFRAKSKKWIFDLKKATFVKYHFLILISVQCHFQKAMALNYCYTGSAFYPGAIQPGAKRIKPFHH